MPKNGVRYLKGTVPLFISALLILSISFSIFFEKIYNKSDFASVIANADDFQRKTVIIDAGHGGEDCGAIGFNGVYEKDLNLQLAMLIGEELLSRGYIVLYTRTEDRLLYKDEENIKGIRKISDLRNRALFASEYSDAIFVSIHMNSFPDSRYNGTQVYYSENISDSRSLALKIQSRVVEDLQRNNNRKIKEGGEIYLLNKLQNVAVLIECGFISNREECEKLSQKEYQKLLSFSIVCGIIEYIENRT